MFIDNKYSFNHPYAVKILKKNFKCCLFPNNHLNSFILISLNLA